jgi:hypothetical protein
VWEVQSAVLSEKLMQREEGGDTVSRHLMYMISADLCWARLRRSWRLRQEEVMSALGESVLSPYEVAE